MKIRRSAIAAIAIPLALIAACSPRIDGSKISTGPVTEPLKPAPVSPLPETRSFTGGPGVGAELNTGIGPGPAFNTPFVR